MNQTQQIHIPLTDFPNVAVVSEHQNLWRGGSWLVSNWEHLQSTENQKSIMPQLYCRCWGFPIILLHVTPGSLLQISNSSILCRIYSRAQHVCQCASSTHRVVRSHLFDVMDSFSYVKIYICQGWKQKCNSFLSIFPSMQQRKYNAKFTIIIFNY